MLKSTKGFYTVEAAVVLPIVIIAVLTLGYFIKAYSSWENLIHGALDETNRGALKSYDRISDWQTKSKIKSRIIKDNPDLNKVKVTWLLPGSDVSDGVICYRIKAEKSMAMPLEMSREFHFDAAIKYREFIGKRRVDGGMGRLALETESGQNPTVIFPREGERFHIQSCTYVKADIKTQMLSDKFREKYSPCSLCKSKEMKNGEIAYYFPKEGNAYHRGTCSSINKFTATMDKLEAIKKGYTPCSKCGGG